MKKNIFKFSLALILVFVFFFAGKVKADGPITIRLQIKTNDASLYDADIIVTACPEEDGSATSTINIRCAVDQTGLTDPSDWVYGGTFLNSFKGVYVSDYINNIYWGWFSNLEYGQVSMTQHILTEGEKILLTYNINPLRVSTDNTTPYINATSTITVEQFGLDASWNPTWTPAASSTLVIDGVEIQNDSGTYVYMPLTSGEKIVYGKKDGYVNSDIFTVTAEDIATSSIHLQIETATSTLFNDYITVSACADFSSATTMTVNAKCAVEQSGLFSDWSWFGDVAFLNYIDAYVNNEGGNGIYWTWFENLNYSNFALSQYVLNSGDKILLTYNTNPLKISIDNATPDVNATSTITVEQFGLDASWNPVWTPAASSTLVIAGQEVENDDGIYVFIATTSEPILIYGKKDGYVNSDSLMVTAKAVQSNNQPTGGSVIIVPPSTGGGGTNIISSPKVDLDKAIDFLISKQADNGSFGSALQTDWAAIALASVNLNSAAAQKAKNYLLTDPESLVGLNPVSDYARRAMALISLNINPYSGVNTNYVKKIIDLYDGEQFGDISLYNDDIFALLVLNKTGYSVEDEMIKNTVNFIISKQAVDGSFQSLDLTAAAIQALKPLSSLDGVSAAILKARNFLFNAQGTDGGFSNTYTTSWVMQAISALGEEVDDWKKNNKTADNYLALNQGADGGLEKDNTYEVNRLWATSYAIPAVKGKAWFNIMQNFSKEVESELTTISASETGIANSEVNENATSTLESLDLATSSPEILITASSTESALEIKTIEEENEEKIESPIIKELPLPVKKVIPKVLAAKITSPAVKEIKTEEKPKLEIKESKTTTTTVINALEFSAKNNSDIIKLMDKEIINATAKKVLYFAVVGTVLAGILLLLKLLGFLL